MIAAPIPTMPRPPRSARLKQSRAILNVASTSTAAGFPSFAASLVLLAARVKSAVVTDAEVTRALREKASQCMRGAKALLDIHDVLKAVDAKVR